MPTFKGEAMTTLSINCIECDVPTKNGNVYPREELERAISDLGDRELLVTLGYSGESVDLSKVVGVTKALSIRGNYLTADIEFIDTFLAKTAVGLLDAPEHFGVRPASICSPLTDGSIRGLEFMYFAVVQDPA
jgi:hypothetical protein